MDRQRNQEIDLPCSSGLLSSLAYYAPGTQMGRHTHDHTQVSFLLSGETLERHGCHEWTPPGFGVGIKPASLVHENLSGPSGVLVFTAGLPENTEKAFDATEPGWCSGRFDPAVTALVRAWLDAPTPERREDVVVDLLALKKPPPGRRGTPPARLEHARQALVEAPHAITIVQAAELAGLHRVRFSMLFREYYGLAPSLYRLRALTARAIREIAGGAEDLSDIAYRIGFSDQAHMTRSVQRATGLSPGRLRSRLF
jgi:AraC-like DNA-binding protein